ncbi:hypothetical protein HAX54_025513 [Datura stramonium]|uniref:Uncharacterized protein n=1 Tax=Datura stramonium TaxID=4076 RepID=A0ABS8UZL6_DATST|nr:hypothetical protein [Datura stramonium]
MLTKQYEGTHHGKTQGNQTIYSNIYGRKLPTGLTMQMNKLWNDSTISKGDLQSSRNSTTFMEGKSTLSDGTSIPISPRRKKSVDDTRCKTYGRKSAPNQSNYQSGLEITSRRFDWAEIPRVIP